MCCREDALILELFDQVLQIASLLAAGSLRLGLVLRCFVWTSIKLELGHFNGLSLGRRP